ncbi:hypothetical protein M758_3G174700 [Ceratodon purpureus]|uniref:Uncharacterized protein n=1 Tax=Ceratodon purpureus TaxID=3225 RepID=A0A8T0IL22_CERPU|nr:hypothetical protein KC19_3G173600 [Ceratodon purpureus]KAG0623438.1 hypothetical protein M758_3G174700 [Ceratodon purpureus]
MFVSRRRGATWCFSVPHFVNHSVSDEQGTGTMPIARNSIETRFLQIPKNIRESLFITKSGQEWPVGPSPLGIWPLKTPTRACSTFFLLYSKFVRACNPRETLPLSGLEGN